ncbi:MAG: hypothetical protein IJS56_06285 [Bacilli bacterium]|nr:hypothetical protein [Bacilli bacterium]
MKKLLVLLIGLLIPSFVFAYSSNELITDEYEYSSLEGNNKQLTNTFVYRDADFTRSSFLGSKSLEVLSIQVASTSLSRWGMNEDPYEVDYRENDYNIKNLLDKMKFNNIKSNAYFNAEKKPNSMGVIIGSKKIIQDDKEYTLLAIVPRSAGYRLEWSGNFNIGAGSIHQGFKAARDEVLRFTKKYINDNNIEGSIKVWTVGYSRGAAISNMIGGFFAGGGIDYFGDKVEITPEDVYCYTIGTPASIKNGMSKNIELSVEGKRDSEDYTKDTEGTSYNYLGGGILDLSSDNYKGIRNIIFKTDAFAKLPPSAWGFTRYGVVIPADEGLINEEETLNDLKSISTNTYNMYTTNGNINKFKRKSFDLANVEIKDEEEINQVEFVESRFNALTVLNPTNDFFFNNYEDALRSAIGTYGMAASLSADETEKSIVSPLIYAFLAYESEILIKDTSNSINTEEEAVALIFKDVLENYTGESIDLNTFTMDQFVKLICKYLTAHENDPVMDKATDGIVSLVPEDYQMLLNMILGQFLENPDEVDSKEAVKEFLKACYQGPKEGTNAYENVDDKGTRMLLYQTMTFALTDSGDIKDFLSDAIDALNSDGEIPEKTFKEFVSAILNMIKTEKVEDEEPIIYSSLADLSDAKLLEYMDEVLLNDMIPKSETIYGKEYKDDLQYNYLVLRSNITKVREIVSYLFFYNEDGYDVVKTINNTLTFVDNISLILLPHYDDLYLAYSRNSKRYDEEYYLIKGNDQTINVATTDPLSVTFNFNHYEFEDRGKVYLDGKELSKDKYNISKGSTIITLNSDYLESLPLGNHVLTAEIDGHQVDADFTLNYRKNPKTNDNLVTYLLILSISLSVLVIKKD